MATAVAPDLAMLAPELTFDELNQLAAAGPQALRVTITPSLAKALLKQNTKNRSLREATVGDYVRDIESGEWPLNGETIKTAINGNVLDGQHRLTAIEKAGVPVETFMVIGLPPETQATRDAGRRRTTTDALTLNDESHATALASILRRAWAWKRGDRKFNQRSTPTTAECRALLEQHPEIRRSAEIAARTRIAFPHIPASALGTAHWLFNAVDPGEAPRSSRGSETALSCRSGTRSSPSALESPPSVPRRAPSRGPVTRPTWFTPGTRSARNAP